MQCHYKQSFGVICRLFLARISALQTHLERPPTSHAIAISATPVMRTATALIVGTKTWQWLRIRFLLGCLSCAHSFNSFSFSHLTIKPQKSFCRPQKEWRLQSGAGCSNAPCDYPFVSSSAQSRSVRDVLDHSLYTHSCSTKGQLAKCPSYKTQLPEASEHPRPGVAISFANHRTSLSNFQNKPFADRRLKAYGRKKFSSKQSSQKCPFSFSAPEAPHILPLDFCLHQV